MKSIKIVVISLVLLCAGAEYACAQEKMTADEARANAKEAYIFTYGLVMNYRTMYRQAIDGDGAFGKWLHLDIATPKDQDIVTPNNDTPYSYAWVDMRAEPWVLTMPKIEKDRFYTSQWDDLWAYVLDNVGSVKDGNDGMTVLLPSPSWKGKLPEGIDRAVRGESEFLGTLTRAQIIGGEEDLARVKQIQQSYKLQPLSDYLGTEAPAAAPEIDWPAWVENDEMTEKYWSYVAFMLPFTTPHPDDQSMYEKMASLGLKRGVAWEPETLDPAIRQAMKDGIGDARAELKKISQGNVEPSQMAGDRAVVNPTYVNRALGVFMGIFINVAQQSSYFSLPVDADGNPFEGGKHNYTLTMSKDQIPPVKYFWSITMYKLPQRWLVENPIKRYSIGSSTPGLKTGKDGSITLYFSAESPGADKESNWLPAPSGSWWMVMRTYGPDDSILDGTYKVPPIKKQP